MSFGQDAGFSDIQIKVPEMNLTGPDCPELGDVPIFKPIPVATGGKEGWNTFEFLVDIVFYTGPGVGTLTLKS